MTRNWISAVILLVILTTVVNAAPFEVYKRDLFLLHKRAVDLEPCDPASTIPLTGSADPDPAAGKTSKSKLTFTAGDAYPKLFLTTTVTDGGKAVDGGVTTADLCAGGLKCPTAKGQVIDITSSTDVPDGAKAPIIEYNVNDGAITIACGKTKAAKAAPAPADGGKAPADGGKAPADGGKAPADGGKAPADGGAGGGGGGGGPPPPDGGGPPPPAGGGPPPPPPDGGAGGGGGAPGGGGGP